MSAEPYESTPPESWRDPERYLWLWGTAAAVEAPE